MFRNLCLLAALSLSACVAVGPKYTPPDVQNLQDNYIYGNRPLYVAGKADEGPISWWQAFDDPNIDRVVALARENNRDLARVAAQLEASRAAASAARRGLLPQGGVGFSITRQEAAQAAFAGFAGGGGGGEDGGDAPPPAGDNPEFTLYQAQAQASWEVDLFGRLRRQTQAAAARQSAQAALLADTERLVIADAVDTYLLLLEALSRRRVALDNLALQRRSLDLIGELFRLGEVPELDVLRQDTDVNTTAAQLTVIENAVADAAGALAVLLGITVPQLVATFPDILNEEADPSLPTARGVIVLSDPASVLRRRPDVAAAERRLAAETYDIGVETAGLFPQVSLDGTASLVALDFNGLSDPNAFGYTAGPVLSWQILSYPRILAQRAAAKAEAKQALATFEQTVLQALSEADRA
ncbi:MAG: TolC family protein, partial [Pseudomonadota bacterium]